MIFSDIEIDNLVLKSDNIDDFLVLFSKYLCGKEVPRIYDTKDFDKGLIVDYVKEIERRGNKLNFKQFNEILLHCNLNQVSKGFFELIFNCTKEKDTI